MTPTTEATIELAFNAGLDAGEAVTRESNGSEAWQAIQFTTKGNRKLQNELKKIDGITRDAYWGYITHAPFSNYYKEDAYLSAYAKVLNANGIQAHKVERLL